VYASLLSLGTAWVWLHCAEPLLRYLRAPRLATRIVVAITVVGIAAQALRATVVVLDEDSVLF